MSRLTASPFHKRPALDYSRPLLSPPEAHAASVVGPAPSFPMPTPAATPADVEPTDMYFGNQSEQFVRPRKVSTLSYNNSGIRESRERVVQRSLKSFLIVIPPANFMQEHGQLGNTLSTGPSHRLAQGILMPLFPTIHGQLTAIAREFNFPSTSGICLYLHYSDSGVTLSPRIGEESWHFLWSNFMEPRVPGASPALPISGRVEFDLDLHKARWYSSWLVSLTREPVDHSTPISPSAVQQSRPSSRLQHRRSDSRTTYTEEQYVDETLENRSLLGSRPINRHLPRQLSLVDRFDTSSTRSGPKTITQAQTSLAISPDRYDAPVPQHVLSPIPQLEEPQSAKHDLERKVNNWRASASLTPSLLAASNGQTSLEPANMPNSVNLDSLLDVPPEELNLDDFTWSISSAGPGDEDYESVTSWDRVPSIGIANRVEGSVCLTPSDRTSFGPWDWDLDYMSYASQSRLPSPDIAQRMLEDVPPTPSTATSWGPPDFYPSSPMSVGYVSSVDIAHRHVFSRPTTPMTATSWGPSSWASSPIMSEYRPSSLHLADRGAFSRPVTPTTATSWGAPLSYPPSPATPFFVRTPDAGERSFDVDGIAPLPTRMTFPYYDPAVSAPWTHVWPYQQFESQDSSSMGAPWAHAWPYQQFEGRAGPWSHSWPYFATGQFSQMYQGSRTVPSYSVVYPYFNLYPAVNRHENGVFTSVQYPTFNLYPAVYPHFDLYPAVTTMSHRKTEETQPIVHSYGQHPSFSLYPAVYPHFDLYPSSLVIDVKGNIVASRSQYPVFNLYPAVYPYFDLYPNVLTIEVKKSIVVAHSQYPIFDLYPTVSYHSHLDTLTEKTTDKGNVAVARSQYPVFNLYPAVYPHFDLYPGILTLGTKKSIVVTRSQYPVFNIYAAIYPYFDLYPSVMTTEAAKSIIVARSQYPVFDLYPAVYPHFNLYPSALVIEGREKMRIAYSQYPLFDLYPAVYPYFNLYPSGITIEVKAIVLSARAQYPVFNLYPATYPHFDLYPGTLRMAKKTSQLKSSGHQQEIVFTGTSVERIKVLKSGKTHAELHRSVMQTLPLNRERDVSAAPVPNKTTPSQLLHRTKKPLKTHTDLHYDVFPKGVITMPETRKALPVPPPKPHSLRSNSIDISVTVNTHVKRTSLTSRTQLPPPAPSPARQLPTPPLKPSIERTGPVSTGTPIPRSRGLPATPRLSRPQSLMERDDSDSTRKSLYDTQPTTGHHRRLNFTPLQRARSMALPSIPQAEEGEARTGLDRSQTYPRVGSSLRKRDSLVLQRVKAFNNREEIAEDLDEFPAPPTTQPPPMPVVSRLDRSRYQFS